jgi:hypothetical protein
MSRFIRSKVSHFNQKLVFQKIRADMKRRECRDILSSKHGGIFDEMSVGMLITVVVGIAILAAIVVIIALVVIPDAKAAISNGFSYNTDAITNAANN